MSSTSWTPIARIALASCVIAFAAFVPANAARMVKQPPSLASVLAQYVRAIDDPGTAKLVSYETTGTVVGSGLNGMFHEWVQDDRHRSDANLGLRGQRLLKLADHYYETDENGISRELTGVLLRRAITQAYIDEGEFARAAQSCVQRGATTIGGVAANVIDVTAPGGDTQTLYLSAATGLPLRVAFDDDDSTTTVAFSDWHSIAGHRVAFRTVTSDGDRRFDTTQVTKSFTIGGPIDPATFTPPASRRIEMIGTQTLGLTYREGHLYVSAMIDDRPYVFLIDTGSQSIVLDKHVVDELKLPRLGNLEASGASRTGGLQLVSVDSIAIGRGTLRTLVATTIDLHGSTAGAFRIDGILGYPFFALALVKLDIANRSMTFGPPNSFVPSGEKLAADLDRQIPEVRFRANGSPAAPFIVDTGNAGELLLYKPFVDRHPGIVPFTSKTRASYGIGGVTNSYRSALDEIDIGSSAIYHVDTDVMQARRGAFADRFDAGNVGLGILANFVVTFDYAEHGLYLERAASFDDGRARN